MSRMLRNSRNDRSTWTDTCECSSCGRGANDRMIRRQQRARERDEFRRTLFVSRDHPSWDHEVAEDIDDMIEWWHETNGAPDGHLVELHEYLGMTREQYGQWLVGGRIDPDDLDAILESLPPAPDDDDEPAFQANLPSAALWEKWRKAGIGGNRLMARMDEEA